MLRAHRFHFHCILVTLFASGCTDAPEELGSLDAMAAGILAGTATDEAVEAYISSHGMIELMRAVAQKSGADAQTIDLAIAALPDGAARTTQTASSCTDRVEMFDAADDTYPYA